MILEGFLKDIAMSAFRNWYAAGHGIILMTKDEHHGLTLLLAHARVYSVLCRRHGLSPAFTYTTTG